MESCWTGARNTEGQVLEGPALRGDRFGGLGYVPQYTFVPILRQVIFGTDAIRGEEAGVIGHRR